MKRSGFALLQLLVALTLSGLLSTTLMISFFQLQKIELRVYAQAHIDRTVHVLRSVLYADVISTFIPTITSPASENKITPASATGSAQEKKEALKLFVSKKGEDTTTEIFTFITTHCMQGVSETVALKPYPVRVTYMLKKTGPGNEYSLIRKQTNQILIKGNTVPSDEISYELARGISAFQVEFLYVEKSENAKEEDKKNIKKKTEWDSDNQDKKMPIMPLYVIFNIKLVDHTLNDEVSLLLEIPLCNTAYGDTLVFNATPKQKSNNVQNETKKKPEQIS